MSENVNIEIPDNMLFFYEVCLMLYNIDAVTAEMATEIEGKYAISKEQSKAIHKWVRRLPDDIIADVFAVKRFDLFNTKVMELLLYDVSVATAKQLKNNIASTKDINSLSSTLGTLLNRVERLEDKYLEHKSQSIRAPKKNARDGFKDMPKPSLRVAS